MVGPSICDAGPTITPLLIGGSAGDNGPIGKPGGGGGGGALALLVFGAGGPTAARAPLANGLTKPLPPPAPPGSKAAKASVDPRPAPAVLVLGCPSLAAEAAV